MTPLPRLVLASSSPRRRELLRELGVGFEIRPVVIDETPHPDEEPAAYVLRLAREKASARSAPGELILAADTAVVLEGTLLGKPRDEAEARAMLERLAGREHTVLTGLALREATGGREATALEESRVRIAPMSREEIAWYAATGEPLDKAGAYAVQGLGALFVEAVTGNYSNVVGLPLPATRRLFAALDYELVAFRDGAASADR